MYKVLKFKGERWTVNLETRSSHETDSNLKRTMKLQFSLPEKGSTLNRNNYYASK